MPRRNGMSRPRTAESRAPWTEGELCALRSRYPHERTEDIARDLGRPIGSVYNKANVLGLRKSREFQASAASGRIREPGHKGRQHQFKRGHVPANKGLRRPGYAPGRMAQTQFKKGELTGRARQIVKPIGFERVSKDGYLERKINNDLPMQARWRAVHLIEWEAVNGPMPPGHALVFINGNKQDIRLDNLKLITRAELMQRNTYHRYGKEFARVIQLRGAVQRQINKRAQREKQAD